MAGPQRGREMGSGQEGSGAHGQDAPRRGLGRGREGVEGQESEDNGSGAKRRRQPPHRIDATLPKIPHLLGGGQSTWWGNVMARARGWWE